MTASPRVCTHLLGIVMQVERIGFASKPRVRSDGGDHPLGSAANSGMWASVASVTRMMLWRISLGPTLALLRLLHGGSRLFSATPRLVLPPVRSYSLHSHRRRFFGDICRQYHVISRMCNEEAPLALGTMSVALSGRHVLWKRRPLRAAPRWCPCGGGASFMENQCKDKTCFS
jgi:hypothetical protein